MSAVSLIGTAHAQTGRLASRQLLWPLESTNVFINGSQQQSALPLRTQTGRAMLPLREFARIFPAPLEATQSGLRLGKLELYPAVKLVRLDGKQMALSDVGAIIDGNTYIAAKVFEVALNATVAFDRVQRVVTVTVSRNRVAGVRLPVARFATDKREYRLGEPVRIVEYSYDPDGLPITNLSYTGREDAYFTPGTRTISLIATNAQGRASEPYSVTIRVSNDTLYSPREYALRFTPLGKTFFDQNVLTYPIFTPNRADDPTPILLSDSPEQPNQSGLLYTDTIEGNARLIAYHINPVQVPGRVLVMVSNLEPTPVDVRVLRFGETSSTQIEALLGQVSLLDFLTSPMRESLRLIQSQTTALYLSAPLETEQGVNLKMDLETTGRVTVSVYFLEESTFRVNPVTATQNELLDALLELPVLDMDSNHVRGTFPGAVRRLKLDLGALPPGAASRLVLGDNVADPALTGQDAITGKDVTLLGNYGVTYKVTLENAVGTVGALVPRGGPYSGAIRVQGMYMSVPNSGVLLRNDLPFVVYRSHASHPDGRVEIEFVPASGSFLPVNLVLYRLETSGSASKPPAQNTTNTPTPSNPPNAIRPR